MVARGSMTSSTALVCTTLQMAIHTKAVLSTVRKMSMACTVMPMVIFIKGNGKRTKNKGMDSLIMRMVTLMMGSLLMDGRRGEGCIAG